MPSRHNLDDSSDLVAVQATLLGDTNAFAAVVDRYAPVLFTLALRMLGDPEEAEDAVQEIFLRAFRSLGRFRLDARFYTWLYTIAMNWLRSRLRRRRRGISAHAAVRSDLAARGHGVPDPADLAVAADGERLAQAAIDRLRPRRREVFVLRQVQGQSVAETATILGIPEGTVKTRLHRARKALAEALIRDAERLKP